MNTKYCRSCDRYISNTKVCPFCYGTLEERINPNPSFEFTLEEVREIWSLLTDYTDILTENTYNKLKKIINENNPTS